MYGLGLDKRENILNYEPVKNSDTLNYLFTPSLCLHSLKGS